ncbi:unnamed protein product [Gulo gulo]|uniref:Uncharacterized protein n=1 Tax=Gulo gulo TaxID=48420 RepID=A0A9X9LYF7_GULGU|nr:unnamed protein product [Gulo gulo]
MLSTWEARIGDIFWAEGLPSRHTTKSKEYTPSISQTQGTGSLSAEAPSQCLQGYVEGCRGQVK